MPQHMDALAKANRNRVSKVRIKRDLHAGRVHIDELILEPPDSVINATVYEMLVAQRQWGRTRAMKVINKPKLHISEITTLGSLTDRQKPLLIEVISQTRKPKT